MLYYCGKNFANEIFPFMEDAGIIIQKNSKSGTRTKFSRKKKELQFLHAVYNYIFLNQYIIQSQYSIYLLQKIIDIVIKQGFKVFFLATHQ